MALNFLNNGYFAGKVGIGTESPDAKLDVRSTSRTAPVVLKLGNGIISGDNGVIVSQIRSYINNSNTAADELARIQVENGSGSHDDGNLSFWTRDGFNNVDAAKQLQINGKGVVELKKSGTAALPVLVLGEDVDTGFYRPSSNNIAISTTGVERMRVTSGGNVGIGTATPVGKLNVALPADSNGNVSTWSSNQVVFTRGGTSTSQGLGFSVHDVDNTATISSLTPAVTWSDLNYRAKNHAFYSNGATLGIYQNIGGNVGIGTTTPSEKLEVEGNIKLSSVGTGNRASSYEMLFYGTTSSGTQTDQAKIHSSSWISNSNGGNLQLYTSNASNVLTERMRIDGAGNVGIGTDSPGAKLEVNGGEIRTTRENVSANYLSLSTTSAGSFIKNAGGTGKGLTLDNVSATSPYINFKLSSSEKMRILANGDVGIGTTSPAYKLQSSGTIGVASNIATNAIRLSIDEATTFPGSNTSVTRLLNFVGSNSGPNTEIGGIRWLNTDSDSGNYQYHAAGITSHNAGESNDGDLRFFVSSDASADSSTGVIEAMRINPTGNVGIGTTSPGSKLEVLGNITLRQSLTNTETNYISTNARGGGSSDADMRLGNSVNGDVLTIHNDKVGIRTSSPSTQLHVVGTGLFTGLVSGITPVAAANFVTKAYVDGSGGGTGPFLPLAGGTMTGTNGVVFPDNFNLKIGTGSDLKIFHNATDSFIINEFGNLKITNGANDKDIIFESDNGSGGTTPYLQLDGSHTQTIAWKDIHFVDGVKAKFGDYASPNLEIYHDGTDSIIADTGTGSLFIQGSDIFIKTNSTENAIFAQGNGKVELFHNNITKFETTSTGVSVTGIASATTFSGDLNGTINTATTGVTQVNAIDNTTIATTAYVNNKIALIPAGLVFQGTWNAATNTPTLTSGSGTTGNFYIVSVAGSTNLDGITDWKVGDWAVFIEQGASDQWEKIDNSSVLDGIGTGQSVTKWDGSGTSNTLTDGPITFSASNNDSTFAGRVDAPTMSIADTDSLDASVKLRVAGNLQIGSDNSGGVITKIYESFGLNLDSGSASRNIFFRINGTEKLKIDTSGNSTFAGGTIIKGNGVVYLGYTDATAIGGNKLEVNGNIYSSGNATFAGEVSLKSRLNLQRSSGGATTLIQFKNESGVDKAHIDFGGTNEELSFFAGDGTTENMTINNSGNVGIGTTAPGGKLQITSPDVGSVRSYTTSNGFGLIFDQYYSAASEPGASYTRTADIVASTGDVSSSQIRFLTKPASSNPAVAMLISGNGNVGIGVTGPQSKLQVAGGIQMADDTDTASATKVGTMRYRTGTEYVEVTGTELITNGDFASSTDWVLKNSASINNGTGVATVPGAGALGATNGNWSLSQASVFAVSTLYRVRFQARRDAGTASEMYVGQSYNLIFNQVLTTAWVEHEVVFTSTSNAGWSNLSFGGVVGTTSEVKEVSVMEVTSEDASYADMCMQTGASTYEWVNIVRNTY